MINNLHICKNDLHKYATAEKAVAAKRFFKTGEGEYSRYDTFIGITVPEIRLVAKKYINILNNDEIEQLLHSKIHEERLLALIILVAKFEKTKKNSEKESIFNTYLENSSHINNWDLVDLSSHKIVGKYIELGLCDDSILYQLIKSDNMWERRIAVVATYTLIKKGKFTQIKKIAKTLFIDKEDLIHKAVGWMLREVGKVNKNVLQDFLIENYKYMPKKMSSYALEHFDKSEKHFIKSPQES